ncbi:MAC/perforin domain-containing protein [Sphingomonas koreensis]
MTMIMVAPIDAADGALFGFGISQLTGDRIPISALATQPDPAIRLPSSSGDQMHAVMVKDSASYSSLMDTVATASASGVSWSASASVSFLREQANDDTSITFTWTRVVRTQDRIFDWSKATVTQEALDTLRQGADAFINKYGTHCIVGIAYGGSFSGYAQIQTDSISDKEKLGVAIQGSASGFGVSGSVSASFTSDLASSNVSYSSTQDTKVVGATPIHFATLDPNGMRDATLAFTPSANGPLPGVTGVPVALLCVSWDQFSDIAEALTASTGDLSLAGLQPALSKLSAEYSKLTYISGTASQLQGSSTIIPAYGPTLQRAANAADGMAQRITRLSLADLRSYSAGTADHLIISPTLQPQTDWIGRGYGQIQVSYSIDWAFNIDNQITNRTWTVLHKPVKPGQPGYTGEVNYGQFNHSRPEGTPDGQQILVLLYTFDCDNNGTPYIAARMHFQDPYAPEETQQQDWPSGPVYLNQTSNLAVTAAWPQYSWNNISVTLVPPTGN